MNKPILFSTLIVISIVGIVITQRMANPSTKQWTIGILQTATHPALNSVRDNFIQEIEKQLPDKVHIVVQNAEGSINNLQSMAQRFHTQSDVDLLFAIATPAAQSLVGIEKNKPIIFAAITDPHGAGLVKPSINNITGITDMIQVSQQIELALSLLPKTKIVALLFNKGEVNAITIAQQMRTLLEQRSINVIDFGVLNESEIGAAMESACRKADLILTPTDNTVASTIKLISSIAQKLNKPVIVSDNMLVTKGVVAAQGADYAASGKQAADMAIQILQEHKKPSELPIVTATSKAVINKTESDRLQIKIPASLSQKVEFVTTERA